MALVSAFLLVISGQALVLIPQIPTNLPARSSPAPKTAPQPDTARANATGSIRQLADGRIAISRATIEACRRKELGHTAPEGVDCKQVMEIVNADARRSAEGALLGLLGEKADVTRGASARQTISSDANAVARDISNGVSSGDAAAVAAHQRGTTPTTSPR